MTRHAYPLTRKVAKFQIWTVAPPCGNWPLWLQLTSTRITSWGIWWPALETVECMGVILAEMFSRLEHWGRLHQHIKADTKWSPVSSWCFLFSSVKTALKICEGNLPVTDGFSSQRTLTQSFDVFFDVHLDHRLSKQSRRRWFETASYDASKDAMLCQHTQIGINFLIIKSPHMILVLLFPRPGIQSVTCKKPNLHPVHTII